MSEDLRYNAVLLKLSKECGNLMGKYAPKLHKASHEDNKGIELSHVEMVKKIQQDCIRICTDQSMKITFSGTGEEELIGEILEYNYDEADVKHMIKVEKVSLFSHLRLLNNNCIKRSDPEWFQFGIHELLQKGKVNPGPLGSKRTQFCKCCGDPVYLSYD